MNWRFLSVVMGYTMVFLVFSGAFLFCFTDLLADSLFGGKRTFFITLLFVYGVYRSFRLYQLHKQIKNDL